MSAAPAPLPSATPTLGSDGAGVTLYLPPNPPTATIQVICDLPGDNGWCRMPVRVRLLGNPAGSPIARLDYTLDGQTLSEARDAFVYEDGLNGTHTVSLAAVDRLGRASGPVRQGYQVDRSIPSAEFKGLTESSLALSISDEGSGIVAWTVQVFDRAGQSVFYYEGGGPFEGGIGWIASPDIYQIELFSRDAAGNEAHFPRTAFVVPTPTPQAVFQQILGFFAPGPAATLRLSTPTASPPGRTPTVFTPKPTGTPVLNPPTTTASVKDTPTPGVVAPGPLPALQNAPPSPILRYLALGAFATLSLAWAAAAAQDRRDGAIRALASELQAVQRMRLDESTLPWLSTSPSTGASEARPPAIEKLE